jgi:hypothetical protein
MLTGSLAAARPDSLLRMAATMEGVSLGLRSDTKGGKLAGPTIYQGRMCSAAAG